MIISKERVLWMGSDPALPVRRIRGKIEQYLVPFAEEMGIPVENIRPYIQARDWEGLVRYLMST